MELRLQGLRQLRGALVAVTLAFGWSSIEGLAQSTGPCGQGFVQHDPIALGCQGGNKRIKFELTEAGTPHHLLLWQAPAGTQGLSATATLSPSSGGRGRASVKVACSNNGKVLVGADGSILNHDRLHAKFEGSHWQWGGDKARSGYGEQFEEWFRVNGSLPCDVEVSFSNDHSTRLLGDIQYEWTGISPCPDVLLGCSPCSEVEATCRDHGQIAVCDGSPFVRCTTEAGIKAARQRGCCYTYLMKEDEGYLDDANEMTKGECDMKKSTGEGGIVGWNQTCPNDAEQAKLWLGGLVPSSPQVAATTTTLASALPTTAASLVVHVPMTHELAGAFALEIQTAMDVRATAFHDMLLAALAESISIHRLAILRFKVVALGRPTLRQLQAASDGQPAQAVQLVRTAEAETGSEIIGVGYDVAAGSQERSTEIQTRLNNMGGPASRVRASLTDILSRQGVHLVAIQVTYPASPVDEIGFFTTPTPLPGGSATLATLPPDTRAGEQNFGIFTAVEGGAVLCAVLAVTCFCMCLLRERAKSKSHMEHDRQRERELDREREAFEAAAAAARRRKDDLEKGGSPGKDAANAGRLGYMRDPAGYEPVQSEDASFLSVNRPASISSDSSDAAGLRLLGNDGM